MLTPFRNCVALFFLVPAFICHFRPYVAVSLPYFLQQVLWLCEFFCKALISWENHEIEKHASRLRQFDTFEQPSMNVFENDSIFIIIFGSCYFNWREIRGKL